MNESTEVLGGGFGKNESLINQELVTYQPAFHADSGLHAIKHLNQ
jgi:hypothetical protein